MVANKYGFKANAKSCEVPNADGIFEECDTSSSCGVDPKWSKYETDAFGPGSQY